MTERPCSSVVTVGRLAKAREFRLAATTLGDSDELSDAYVTLCIHAGIAAADVICCRRLGVHNQGENHNEAIASLGRVDR